jgi:Fe-S-cluster-containing dehydrogenase component/anaerobic selenocysteine-containing dehydrogenase
MSHENRDEFALPEWSNHLQALSEAGDLDQAQITMEFPDGSEPLTLSRRDFLRVASAAAAATGLAATTGCRAPQDKVVPYVKRPEGVHHGVPQTFTSVCKGCAAGCGILMTVREGRVTKLEGNPDHPVNRGALCAVGQAMPLSIYDPARLVAPRKAGADIDHAALQQEATAALKGAARVRLLTPPLSGPAERALAAAFVGQFTDGAHVQWEPAANTAQLAAHKNAYGEPFSPHYRVDKADAIVSFGSEFLDGWTSGSEHARGFAQGRDPESKRYSKFIAFEGRMTLTGAAADERHRVAPSDFLYVALAVAHELILGNNLAPLASDPNVRAALKDYSADSLGPKVGVSPDAIKGAAAALKDAGPRGLAIAGRNGGGADAARLEAVVALLNEALGAVGTTVEHKPTQQGSADFAAVKKLVTDLNAGVDVLIVVGLNPAYDAPPALGLGEAVTKAKNLIVIDTHPTETGDKAALVAPAAHFLESWGDSNPLQGVYAVQQPGLQPLSGQRHWADYLLGWSAEGAADGFAAANKASAEYKDELGRPSPGPWHFYLHARWTGPVFEQVAKSPMGGQRFWEDVLRQGALISREAGVTTARKFNAGALQGIAGTRPDGNGDQIELFFPAGVRDGRHADNPVLQELPDPVMRLSWTHYVGVPPKRFTELGLQPGSVLKVTAGDASVELPAVIMPGLPDNTFAIPVGYGREVAGVVGKGIGQNAYKMAAVAEEGVVYTGIPAQVAPTGATQALGIPRGLGQVIDQSVRYLVPVTTLPQFQQDPASGAPRDHHPAIWDVHKYEGLKWSMTIDLSRCTGCAACVVACQVENNIPVVGKQGVIEGRLMHWIRIDRYWSLPPKEGGYEEQMLTDAPEVAAAQYLESPEVLFEPMLCQHCDNAPCETVCPVAATVHSTEGLNEQVYNRCVGTRYCANNCPYKVRRFNWYSYNDDRSQEFLAGVFPELVELADLNAKWPRALRFNPDVTVRTRGVMEKCSFCVQRLQTATKIYRKGGLFKEEPKTACQQTCATEAISFGNVLDPKTAVAQKFNSPRAFAVIEHVGTKPAVHYLTRVRNVPAPAVAAANTEEKAH